MGRLMIGNHRVMRAMGGQSTPSIGKYLMPINSEQLQTGINNLPSEYTKLEYIESNGNQWIDTMYRLGGVGVKVDAIVELTSNNYSNYPSFVGRTTANGFEIYAYQNRWWLYNKSNASVSSTEGVYPFIIYHIIGEITASKQTLIVNDVTYTKNVNSSNGSQGYIQLFAQAQNYRFTGRIYNFIIYKDGELVGNCIPALRNMDNKPGMYDVLNNDFYINNGNGEFSYKIALDTSIQFSKVFYS